MRQSLKNTAFVKSPCMGCTIRTLGCHGKCGQYAVYRKNIEKEHVVFKNIKEQFNGESNSFFRQKGFTR